EGVDNRSVGIGDQEHVRLLDLLEPADGRPVEAQAFLEDVLGELVGRDREVLHEPGQVTEADVDDGDVLVRKHADDVCRTAFRHGSPPYWPLSGSGRYWESPRGVEPVFDRKVKKAWGPPIGCED